MSMPNRRQLAGVAILLVAAVGVGLVVSDRQRCGQYGTSVDEEFDGYEDAPTRAYANLSETRQTTFTDALGSDAEYVWSETPVFDRPTKVSYEGRTYLVGTVSNDC